MEGKITLRKWIPQPGPQRALYECPFQDILYGGARGGGKTDGGLGKWAKHLLDQEKKGISRHCTGLIVRRLSDELTDLKERARSLFPEPIARWYASTNHLRFKNGAKLYFRALERDNDAIKFQGREFTFIWFEEAGAFPTSKPIDLLHACLRSPIKGMNLVFLLTCNPGGKGHNWIKQRYVDPAPAFTPFEVDAGDGKTKMTRIFIPAKVEDNKILLTAQPAYIANLMKATEGEEWLRKAWLLGDWDIVAGGMFDSIWNPQVHILPEFNIPHSWFIYRSYDWGSKRPFSIGWWAVTDDTMINFYGQGRTFAPGTLIRVAELYGWNGKPDEGVEMAESDIARHVLRVDHMLNRRILPGPADVNIFAAVREKRLVDEHIKFGINWKPADKSPGSRVTGWKKLRDMLVNSYDYPMEEPGLFVTENCRHFIRTVPLAQRDPRDQDDVDTDTEDHVLDETRYMVLFKPTRIKSVSISGF